MKIKIRLLLFILISVVSFTITAASNPIYKSVDAQGIVTYSDQPNAQAETVTLSRENVAKKPVQAINSTDATGTTDAAKTNEREEYTDFFISSPKDQDTFQNATEISVSVDVTPALQKGDTIEFYFDGTSVDAPSTNTSITIPKMRGGQEIITRGSHTLSASVLNASGDKLITARSITIFVHYASVAFHTQSNTMRKT